MSSLWRNKGHYGSTSALTFGIGTTRESLFKTAVVERSFYDRYRSTSDCSIIYVGKYEIYTAQISPLSMLIYSVDNLFVEVAEKTCMAHVRNSVQAFNEELCTHPSLKYVIG